MNKFVSIRGFISKHKKIVGFIVIVVLVGIFLWTKSSSSQKATQYQTSQVTKGTLVVSLTETGQVSVANKVSIVTQASGIVSNVYIKNGDKVNAGDKIAD